MTSEADSSWSEKHPSPHSTALFLPAGGSVRTHGHTVYNQKYVDTNVHRLLSPDFHLVQVFSWKYLLSHVKYLIVE